MEYVSTMYHVVIVVGSRVGATSNYVYYYYYYNTYHVQSRVSDMNFGAYMRVRAASVAAQCHHTLTSSDQQIQSPQHGML
jgi:hypothetical protein